MPTYRTDTASYHAKRRIYRGLYYSYAPTGQTYYIGIERYMERSLTVYEAEFYSQQVNRNDRRRLQSLQKELLRVGPGTLSEIL